MQYISKALVAGGLVILTGPLCFTVQAQADYVDVEAERAAAAAAGLDAPATAPSSPPADPYGVKPAQAYPATSYGLDNAPAAAVTAPGAANGAGQNLGQLFYQMQQLQQEVMRLNGKVEQQAHELRTLKEQSLQRYVDLDKRLSGAGGSNSVAVAAGSGGGNSPVVAPAAAPAGGQAQVPEQPGEGTAYRAAYALVDAGQFDPAIQGFQQFLQEYPDGKYAANAHYWLGELYLVKEPQDLESARQSFMLLLSQYPDSHKVPAAMYKLGKVQYLKGNPEKAREYMDRLIREYGSSGDAAVNLAREFIARNY